MAVLAPQDWHPPRDHSMDAPTNTINTSVPRQRSSPANDHSATSTPISQQPYPYPVQQQQAGWSSPHPQQPYYPSFYQNHHQQPYQLHAHPGQGQMHAQSPYYDPTNAQFAQWAYQQMVYNAHQAHHMSHVSSPQPHPGPRSRAGSASTGEYFVPPQVPAYSAFPSGTPPAHPSQLPNAYNSPQSDQSAHQTPYNGYHPYRRPNRQASQHQESSQAPPNGDWRAGSFQPPYARTDAAGSSTSVNSASSHSGSSRHRTNSLQGSAAPSGSSNKSPSATTSGRGPSSPASSSSAAANLSRPHQRTTSSSSNSSSAPSRPSLASSSSASTNAPTPTPIRKPSPLSQGTYTAAEKRMSRDDSDLTAMLEPAPGVRSGGLKGRLRRALSLNAGATLREEEEVEQTTNGSSRRPAAAGGSSSTILGDDESTATVQKKKSKSLFNSRLNRSTDNISLSSTMSSASMVIRKLGSIGKLTRRNSLAGITSLFKDKKDKEGGSEDDGKKGKKKKDGKAQASEPSVSLATAELDPTEWSPDMNGLSPAARLARQHTLKTNAEAAARAKAEQEAKAAAAKVTQGAAVPGPWEKNTTTRHAENAHGKGLTRINEDGSRVLVEDDDSDSDDDHNGHGTYHQSMEGWEEDDDDWGEVQDEDVTIRQSMDAAHLDDEEMEPWAINIRRSEERTRKPAKGILKSREGVKYDQEAYAARTNMSRNRSNSYDSTPSHGPELGPLAHIPSPDPDHIDGLHKHSHPASSQSPFLPPLSFDSKSITAESPKDSDASTVRAPSPVEKTLFSHPNSSAPALSTMFSSNPPTLTHRSATAPAKRLAFATNLSVYDTFPATVYDRRSEPATWSRLTPTLAQRIKEELNSYKMEEMEVHAASRVHTQFFV